MQNKMDHINDNLNYGERALRSIGSVFGSIANSFIPEKGPTVTATIPSGTSLKKETLASGSMSKSYGNGSAKDETRDALLKMLSPDQQKKYLETENDLDEIESLLADLKHMGHAMGAELDNQNKNIDTLTNSVDNANAKLYNSNKKIYKLL